MNDITALAQRMKAAAENLDGDTWHDEGVSVYGGAYDVGDTVCYDHIVDCENVNGESLVAEFIAIANPANVLALVEALEKAQQQNGHIREQSAEWERKAISNFEECVEMSARIEELEAQRKLAFTACNRWRDKCAELESRTVTVKLPKLYGIDFCDHIVPDSGNGFLFYSEQVVEILAAAGIQVIEGDA